MAEFRFNFGEPDDDASDGEEVSFSIFSRLYVVDE